MTKMSKAKLKSEKLFDRVYEVVAKIPEGKVATYGQIAGLVGTKDARKVGWPRTELASSRGLLPRSRRALIRGKAIVSPRIVGFALHANKDPKVPCHRVVNKNGRVATNYAFEGWEEQKRRLVEEGVGFVDEKHVDIEKFFWNPQ